MVSLPRNVSSGLLAPLLLSAVLKNTIAVVETCFGKTQNLSTQLDFDTAAITENTLHSGGILKYEDIGFIGDRAVDLVVSVVPGTTYTSFKGDKENGKNTNGTFGKLNLQTLEGDLNSGEGNFRFCLHDHESGELATAESFRWTVYDFDQRSYGIDEKMTMDLSQVEDYVLYPNADETEIGVSCEDSGSESPCAEGENTVFSSSTTGPGSDNPSDPDNLTEQQKKRGIVFSFRDTSCWDFTYNHFCRVEVETNGAEKCPKYTGGNVLYAGDSDAITETGECIVPPTFFVSDPESCVNNPNPFQWKGKETSCDLIKTLPKLQIARKCKPGRKIIGQCPGLCAARCATPSPTVTPIDPRGVCVNNPDSFEWKGKVISCEAVALLGQQQQSLKCKEGRRLIKECPALCDDECKSVEFS